MHETSGDFPLLSTHGRLLVYLALFPGTTMRDMAQALGMTERQAARLVRDLTIGDVVRSQQEGRRKTYTINGEARVRHPVLSDLTLRQLGKLFYEV
jgi:DNA-binding MarR family transcriptional regulator